MKTVQVVSVSKCVFIGVRERGSCYRCAAYEGSLAGKGYHFSSVLVHFYHDYCLPQPVLVVVCGRVEQQDLVVMCCHVLSCIAMYCHVLVHIPKGGFRQSHYV